MDSLMFEWFAEGSYGYLGGTGRLASRWRGTATETRKIGVAVTMLGHGHRTRMLHGTAVVRSRNWQLGTLGAELEYDSLPGYPDYYGLYDPPDLAGNMFAAPGTGPWEGTHYIFSSPRWIGELELYVHTDFKHSGNPYLVADTTCELAAELIGQSVNVRSLNWICGRGVALGNFHDSMVAHENMHRTSINECVTTVNRLHGRLAEIEGIVDSRSGEAVKAAERLWTRIVADLDKAYETDQKGQRSGDIWSWRPSGPWLYGPVRIKDHDGKRGCP